MLLKAVITAFSCVSLPFLAVPLRSQPTVAIRTAAYIAAIQQAVQPAEPAGDEGVVLAVGAWAGVLCALDAKRHKRRLVVWEPTASDREHAAALLAAVGCCSSRVAVPSASWDETVQRLTSGGGHIAAVVAEPFFSNIGQHWGPGPALQYAALLGSVSSCTAAVVVPAAATLMGCLVECAALHAAAADVGQVVGLDLSAMNSVRPAEHWQAVRGCVVSLTATSFRWAPPPVLKFRSIRKDL
eukprot:SAG22_NODE_1520_length_4237_cov_11.486225_3_plen_241_part_00